MPALRPVSGVARVAIRVVANSTNIVNVIHVQKAGGSNAAFTQAEIDAVALGVKNAWVTNMMPLVSSAVLGQDVTATDLTTNLGAVGTSTFSTSGTGSGVTTPNSLACCITWKIARHYRGGHPRTYLGPPATATIANGTSFTGAHVTAVLAAATAFRTAVNAISGTGAPYSLCTVHRWQDKTQLVTPLVSIITGEQVDNRLDTQRRRLGKDR